MLTLIIGLPHFKHRPEHRPPLPVLAQAVALPLLTRKLPNGKHHIPEKPLANITHGTDMPPVNICADGARENQPPVQDSSAHEK